MDLTLPIIGIIGFLGYKLNTDGKKPRKNIETRKGISPHETPSGKNIYHSNFTKEIDANERKIANIQFQKSKNPTRTNIIPPLYNTYCKWDCGPDDKTNTRVKLETTILPSVADTKEIDLEKRKIQIMSGPMFRETTYQGKNIESDTTSGGMHAILKEDFSNISSLTGQPIEMKHNNMVPFFGSNVTQNTRVNNNSSILANYTGSQEVPTKKREACKMFEAKKENIFGARPFADLVEKDRFVQSNFKQNILPVPQIMVQPLPEEIVRPSYKDIDSLRVKTNPQVSYSTPVIAGQGITKRGVQGKVFKNAPDTFYINNPDRYFTTVGEIKAPAARENFSNLKFTPKAETSEIAPNVTPAYGPTRSEGQSRLVRRSNVEFAGKGLFTIADDDTKQTYEQDWIRNAKHETGGHNYLDRKGYKAFEQERETTNRMNILPAKDLSQGYYQAMPDQAKTTHKEGNLFSYTGTASCDVSKPMDYTADYNYTREKQAINNPDYKGAPGQASRSKVDTTQYDNINISTYREGIADKKGYTAGGQKENTPLGACGVNIYKRDDSIRQTKYEYGANVNRVVSEPSSLFNIGCPTDDSNKDITEHDFKDRIDPGILNAFKKNPYTKSLQSF